MARRDPTAPVYQAWNTVRDIRGVVDYLDFLLQAKGFEHLNIRVNPRSDDRLWIDNVRVELKKPTQVAIGYYGNSFLRRGEEIPKGYALRAGVNSDINRAVIGQNRLGSVLGTIAHEVFGHLLSPLLKTRVDEEGKAYALQAEWILAMRELGIAGLEQEFDNFLSSTPSKKIWPDNYRAHKFIVSMLNQGYPSGLLHEDFCRQKIWIPDSFS